MLMATHLIGFGAGGTVNYVAGTALTVSSPIGDMSSGGGLAAAFDGTLSQNFSASARRTASTAYVGANFSSVPKRVFKWLVYGSTDEEFNGAGGDVTITFYWKSSAPSAYNDGTVLASLGPFTDGSSQVEREIINPTPSLLLPYTWVAFTGIAAGSYACAEAKPIEAVEG